MLLFSCKKASRLISDSLDRPLTFQEKCKMRFHLLICSMCRRARKHLKFLQNLDGDSHTVIPPIDPQSHLSLEAKDRIKKTLQSEENSDA